MFLYPCPVYLSGGWIFPLLHLRSGEPSSSPFSNGGIPRGKLGIRALFPSLGATMIVSPSYGYGFCLS
jgi:hypothetical protein